MSDQLFPTPETFTLSNGAEVVIHKTKTRHVAAVTKFIAKLVTDLGSVAGMEFMQVTDSGQILQLIANYADELPVLMAMHCSLSVDEIQDLDADDAALLLLTIIDYNKRFFSERVAPRLQAGVV